MQKLNEEFTALKASFPKLCVAGGPQTTDDWIGLVPMWLRLGNRNLDLDLDGEQTLLALNVMRGQTVHVLPRQRGGRKEGICTTTSGWWKPWDVGQTPNARNPTCYPRRSAPTRRS